MDTFKGTGAKLAAWAPMGAIRGVSLDSQFKDPESRVEVSCQIILLKSHASIAPFRDSNIVWLTEDAEGDVTTDIVLEALFRTFGLHVHCKFSRSQ